MSEEISWKTTATDLGEVANSIMSQNAPSLATSDVNKAIRKALDSTSIAQLSEKMASAMKDAGALSPLDDAVSRAFSINVPDFPHLATLNNQMSDYAIPDLSSHFADCQTDWHQLIIIGNGFDLACGLKSRFGDFFEPRFKAIASISDYSRATWSEVVGHSGLTLWDFILQANVDSLWCDVEAVIERWVLSASTTTCRKSSPFNKALEFIKLCPFADGSYMLFDGRKENEHDEENFMYGNLARYVWTVRPEIAKEGYSRELFAALLKNELFRLEKAFSDYLINELAANADYASNYRKLYHAIERDGKKSGDDYYSSTSVLSFNYTEEVSKSFDGGEDGEFVNIHGKLGEEIIFGIDGKDCMDNPDAVSFTKTFRLMRRGGSRTDKLIRTANSMHLQDATDVIKFYGHSLGKADYSYFQSIFDGVDLYESKTVLVFYYPFDSTNNTETKNAKWRTNLANSINNLLVAYGTTMGNTDHGKNLMHKLLLEGRLIIRGIQLN